MRVFIPSALRSYTGGKTVADASGKTVAELLEDLDRHYPGIRFRMVNEQDMIRPHLRVFVNGQVAEPGTPVKESDEVNIVMALSGG
ncbi:MAG: MoaD/ThiS family protein [Deltaproteobacteria bacterium]|nr:MoaD/ThiS family protein [Deltaproteobacteria bacterium]